MAEKSVRDRVVSHVSARMASMSDGSILRDMSGHGRGVLNGSPAREEQTVVALVAS